MKDEHITLVMIFSLVSMLAGLSFTVWNDPYIRREHRRTMLTVAGLLLSLVAENYAGFLVDMDGTRPFLRTVLGIYAYAARPLPLALLLDIVSPRKNRWYVWALVGFNALVFLTALFSDVAFSIDAENSFHRGPLGYTCHAVSGILLIYLLILSLREYRHVKRREALLPVLNALLILLSVALDTFVDYRIYPVSFLTAAMVIGNVFYYIWLHLQFVRQHEQVLLAGQRVQLMLSQIKPHFLHNSLAVIAELCDTDPQTAKLATVKFSKYLRGNMSSIESERAIPFEKELEHTRLYLDIEQLRFEDALRVRYDIGCTGFSIPALTLQPLAENAVRHGVRENPGGRGTVTIRTRERPDGFEVSVIDDGQGFDASRLPEDDKPHVGIENVRERLKQVCGGTLEISSGPGEGTTATISLPKAGQGR